MTTPTLHYDEASDTLYISFAPGEHATGIELNEHILLRINKAERRAVGLTIFEYSLLAQPTASPRPSRDGRDREAAAIRRLRRGSPECPARRMRGRR